MPGEKTRDEIVVAPEGRIMVAEVGAEAPGDSTEEWSEEWRELGYATEDGVTLTVGKDVTDIRGWQSLEVLRRVVTGRTITSAFTLRQLNVDTLPFAYGGGEVTEPSPGEYRYEPPDAGELPEKALGIEWTDGDKHYRMIFVRGSVTEAVETQLIRNDSANLPVTYGVLGEDGVAPFYLLTDDPAFEPIAS